MERITAAVDELATRKRTTKKKTNKTTEGKAQTRMEEGTQYKADNGGVSDERGILDGPSETRSSRLEYSCISYFKNGKCPRAHTKFCPFVIKGKDYSSECMYE